MELDKDRLAKLLNLTESDQDGEALAAIRKANELLRQYDTDWSAALGIAASPDDGATSAPPPTATDRPIYTPPPSARRVPDMPEGYQLARSYRNALRCEPLVPRVLAFPFWIFVELLAIVRPYKWLNTRGSGLATVFTLSMMTGIVAWIALGYYIVFG